MCTQTSTTEAEKQMVALEQNTKKRRSKKIVSFGQENIEFIKRDFLKGLVDDPIKSVQTIIERIHFNEDHPEYMNIRVLDTEKTYVEIYVQDAWVKKAKAVVYNKLIYKASDILEYNVPKKYWTKAFADFVSGMGQIDNDDLVKLIHEEVDNTIITKSRICFNNAENEEVKNGTKI